MSATPEDLLERCLTLPLMNNVELTDEEVTYFLHALEALHKKTTLSQAPEELVQVDNLIEKPPKFKLKKLPENLRYAFLGSDSTYLVIISSVLIELEEEKLLRVLRKHKSALG